MLKFNCTNTLLHMKMFTTHEVFQSYECNKISYLFQDLYLLPTTHFMDLDRKDFYKCVSTQARACEHRKERKKKKTTRHRERQTF